MEVSAYSFLISKVHCDNQNPLQCGTIQCVHVFVVPYEELSATEACLPCGGLRFNTALQYTRGYTQTGYHQYSGKVLNTVKSVLQCSTHFFSTPRPLHTHKPQVSPNTLVLYLMHQKQYTPTHFQVYVPAGCHQYPGIVLNSPKLVLQSGSHVFSTLPMHVEYKFRQVVINTRIYY